MTYLALGDSISIDDYTEVKGGGAASQFARLIDANPFVNLTRDGTTTDGLRSRDLSRSDLPRPDVVTLTIGGNDLLGGFFERRVGDRTTAPAAALDRIVANLETIGERLTAFGCPTILNTVYDPTDGDDAKARELDLVPEARHGLTAVNRTIGRIARERGFLLCDLEALFRGHGFWSAEPWIVMHIEPNLIGATQIAEAWRRIYGKGV